MATVVSIGRNVAEGRGEPLSEEEWLRFIGETVVTVRAIGADIYFRGDGAGEWGVGGEESFTIIFDDVDTLERAALVASLAVLAASYGQESIALTTGETEFVASDVDTLDQAALVASLGE
jgi:hypothetical protein